MKAFKRIKRLITGKVDVSLTSMDMESHFTAYNVRLDAELEIQREETGKSFIVASDKKYKTQYRELLAAKAT